VTLKEIAWKDLVFILTITKILEIIDIGFQHRNYLPRKFSTLITLRRYFAGSRFHV